jgi:hypothetical protein
MKLLQIIGIIGAITIIAVFPLGKDASAKPAAFEREMMLEWQRSFSPSGDPSEASQHDISGLREEKSEADTAEDWHPRICGDVVSASTRRSSAYHDQPTLPGPRAAGSLGRREGGSAAFQFKPERQRSQITFDTCRSREI